MRVGIVLAAGASRRMGRPKLTLDLGGKSLLERSIETLREAGIDRIVVVVAPGSEDATGQLAGGEVSFRINPEAERGLSSSMRVALEALPPETGAVIVALADVPLVKAETIQRLLGAFEAENARAAYPVYRGRQGHPVVFSRSLVPELEELEGDRGAKSVLEGLGEDAIAVPVDDPFVCFDIDTPEDYARARERLREKDGLS